MRFLALLAMPMLLAVTIYSAHAESVPQVTMETPAIVEEVKEDAAVQAEEAVANVEAAVAETGEAVIETMSETIEAVSEVVVEEQAEAVLQQQEKKTTSLDTLINEKMTPVSNAALSVVFYSIKYPFGATGDDVTFTMPLILIWLVFAAIFFTFYFGFANLTFFKHAIDLVRGKHDKHSGGDGQINRFQALTTSLSGTVGLGNIAGVAVAISVGGPGAMFWMILMGFFGMSSKFVECALGVKYRHKHADGRMFGGPMYYLRDGFAEMSPKLKPFGAIMGLFFAVCCIGGALGGGNMFQANQAFGQFVYVTGGETSFFADKGWLFGLVLAGLVAAVILGGIQQIAKVASKIVPFMAAIYLFAGLVLVLMNITEVPAAFVAIFKGAFGLDSVAGGFLGAIIQGVRRAAFSNEAGIGSAAIAHAAAQTDSAVSQGFVAMLGPFIDTVVICTMTALVIVVSGVYVDGAGMEGVALTSRAFETAFPWFPYLLALAVFLFAFSTMIAWSYYGVKAFTYIFGESTASETVFKLVFCAFTVIGASAQLGTVIDFTDAMIFAMAVPNIIGLYFLAPGLKRDVQAYAKELGR